RGVVQSSWNQGVDHTPPEATGRASHWRVRGAFGRARGLEEMTTETASRRLVFLGSGTASGVPVLGRDCAVLTSDGPRDSRYRPSVLLQCPGGSLLIDATPEMRIQLLREKVRQVHAIAFTHAHADHFLGLDDARVFPHQIGGPVPIYCEESTEA